MRIALVSEHASPLATLGGVDSGGQNVHVAALASGLGALGHEVVVHTRRESPHQPETVRLARGVDVVHVDAGPARPIPKDELFGHMSEFAAALARSWREWRPDLVHAHFWMSGWAAQEAAWPLRIPLVQTFHALGVVKRRHQGTKDTSPPERFLVEERLARTADHVIATCSDEAFELARLGCSAGRTSIVPCGVDVNLFRPDPAGRPRIGRRRRLLVVSRLVERKGIADTIRALPGVEGAELVVAGGPPADELASDPEAVRLAQLARRLGVADRVEMRGQVDRRLLPGLYRSAEIVVCVPWYEPFGIVPLEAMACGVPVVASAVGGLADTVVDGVTGVHVPPRHPDALAQALTGLLADRRRRRSLAAAGVERARNRYSWPRVAAATLGIYAPLVGSHRAAAVGPQ